MTNMMKLQIAKISRDAVAEKGIAGAIEMLLSKDRICNAARASEQWAKDAVDAVRNAEDPNPWRNMTDEEIAGELVERIKERGLMPREAGEEVEDGR